MNHFMKTALNIDFDIWLYSPKDTAAGNLLPKVCNRVFRITMSYSPLFVATGDSVRIISMRPVLERMFIFILFSSIILDDRTGLLILSGI
jgi:hypothetical protein